MKKITALICLPLLFLISCASTPVSSSVSEGSVESENRKTERTDKKERPEKKENQTFDDWKYKGFGYELPRWVEPAVLGNTKKVASVFAETIPDCTEADLEIVLAYGKNVDQSENKMKTVIAAKGLEKNQMLDGVWVRFNIEKSETKEEPYVTVLVFKK